MIPIRNAVPSRYPPVITWMLIVTNCLVFLFQDSLPPYELELLLRQFALIPARYSEAFASGETDLAAVDFLPFFSMMFLHGGWLHLILNTVAVRSDHRGSAGSWPLSGVLSCLRARGFGRARHVQPDFDRTRIRRLRRDRRHSRVLHAPVSTGAGRRGRPNPVHPAILEVYAYVFIGLWFLLQLLGSMAELLQPSSSGGVAWWAHVGGFVAGLILGPLLVRSEQRYRVYYPDEGTLGFDTRGRI
jgi:membrane associated rhomboid family serine protease